MRTLSNHQLIIDKNCPMCQIYGKGFEKTGMLAAGSCSPYQTIGVATTEKIDMNKARNEIAFYNTQTHEVLYGIDSLVFIITHYFAFLKPILQNKPVDFFLRKLYKFISYNRKVIAPSRQNESERNCTPDLNLKYRLLYIFFVVICSTFVLFHFTKPINQLMGWENHLGREFLVCFGQIIWQSVVLTKIIKEKLLDYLGNMMTVSMIGTLLLLPILFINNLSPVFHLIYFGIVVNLMLFEHIRRCKILDLGWLPSISWVSYRLVVLAIIDSCYAR